MIDERSLSYSFYSKIGRRLELPSVYKIPPVNNEQTNLRDFCVSSCSTNTSAFSFKVLQTVVFCRKVNTRGQFADACWRTRKVPREGEMMLDIERALERWKKLSHCGNLMNLLSISTCCEECIRSFTSWQLPWQNGGTHHSALALTLLANLT